MKLLGTFLKSILLALVLSCAPYAQEDVSIAQKLDAKSTVELLERDTNLVILDVRTPEEYQEGHLPNSINMDFQAVGFPASVKQLDSTKTYLIYCRSGGRSDRAQVILTQAGLKSIDVRGGYLALVDSGVEMIR